MGINYNPSIVIDGLILCLDAANSRSYAGTGITWTDISGNNKSGTGQTGVSYSSLNSGKFIFNGAESGYFSIPLVTSTITNVTMCCWVNITSLSLRGPFIVNGSFTGYAIGVGFNSYDDYGNRLIALFPGNRWISTGVSLGLGWKHVAITLDGSSLPRIYLNGQLINSYAGMNPRVPTTATYIGREVGGEGSFIRAFGGEVGMAQMYNRQLSDAEILQNYNAGRKKYNPEENIVTDSAVFIVDANNTRSYTGSGSGFTSISGPVNGTLINSPTFSTGVLTFNGSNQYVDFGNSSSVQQSSGTLSAWVKSSSPGSGYKGIIAKQGAYGIFYFDSILITYDWGTGSPRSTGINIADGNWKNVVVTYQSGVTNGTIVYLNGSSVLTTTITVSNQATGNLYGSAEANAGQIAACTAAAFSMYSRVLSSTEVLQNYNALRLRFNL